MSINEYSIEDLSMIEEGEVLKVFQTFLSQQPKGKKINPKKVKQLAKRITPLCAPHIINGLIYNVLAMKDPVGYLFDCFEDIQTYAVIIRDFVESGHHGMVQVGRQCYPVKLVCPEKWLRSDDPWHPEDEQMIGADMCNAWMKEYNKGVFHGRAILFSEFGFTGIPREFEMRCTTNLKGLKKHPGTNFYTKP